VIWRSFARPAVNSWLPATVPVFDGFVKKQVHHPAGIYRCFYPPASSSPGAGHSLLAADLIDNYWFNLNPVIIGNGIPVFKDNKAKTNLELTSSKLFSSGVVCLYYSRKK
jgi:hypothetical protein